MSVNGEVNDCYWGMQGDVGRCDNSRCDTPQGGVEDVRKVCQVMERCDGHGGDLEVLEKV